MRVFVLTMLFTALGYCLACIDRNYASDFFTGKQKKKMERNVNIYMAISALIGALIFWVSFAWR